jgi:D-glycero-D-manno-heptose 1,7-bisphosphate phosphatase
MKILFLDLDGTIRETKSGAKFINDPYDQKAIDGANTACDQYHKKGWNLIGITNQGGVALLWFGFALMTGVNILTL